MRKKLLMQRWAHDEIEEELKEAERRFFGILEAQGLEFVYFRVGGQWMFYIRKKAKKKTFADDFSEDVGDALKVWSSGLILSLVEFAIAMEAMGDFIQELLRAVAEKSGGVAAGTAPPSVTGHIPPSPC